METEYHRATRRTMMLGHRDHQMHGGGGTDAHAGLVRGALADYASNGEYLDDCVPLNIYIILPTDFP
jgi:hypothetical protein